MSLPHYLPAPPKASTQPPSPHKKTFVSLIIRIGNTKHQSYYSRPLDLCKAFHLEFKGRIFRRQQRRNDKRHRFVSSDHIHGNCRIRLTQRD
ncbi:hypothetical protein KGM_210844 [Danaus plexippus plexippus]|uniref:Uncharacterized protein n=1 Tax=Danaus plexippus plexippus TaxID=278856 RepID=A0A212EHM5_DANPL|nr:hypothetical protein KGM_210844 [Danaus plexippus plexippus]